MAIHGPTGTEFPYTGYVISGRRTGWLPGIYEDEAACRSAFLTDHGLLARLTREINGYRQRLITKADLVAARKESRS